MSVTLFFSTGKLIHATDHVTEGADEFLTLLQDVNSEQKCIQIGCSFLHAVQGTLAVTRNLLLHMGPYSSESE